MSSFPKPPFGSSLAPLWRGKPPANMGRVLLATYRPILRILVPGTQGTRYLAAQGTYEYFEAVHEYFEAVRKITNPVGIFDFRADILDNNAAHTSILVSLGRSRRELAVDVSLGAWDSPLRTNSAWAFVRGCVYPARCTDGKLCNALGWPGWQKACQICGSKIWPTKHPAKTPSQDASLASSTKGQEHTRCVQNTRSLGTI